MPCCCRSARPPRWSSRKDSAVRRAPIQQRRHLRGQAARAQPRRDRRSWARWQPEPLGFGCEVERIASPSENPSDDDNEADDGQDGPNDAHGAFPPFYFSSFSVVCSKCDISAAIGSDGAEGEYR